jgi:hypothetical protein
MRWLYVDRINHNPEGVELKLGSFFCMIQKRGYYNVVYFVPIKFIL